MDEPSTFELMIVYGEAAECVPLTCIHCQDVNISCTILEFNRDENRGYLLFDMDWTELNTIASGCLDLATATMHFHADSSLLAELAEGMAVWLKFVHDAGRFLIMYEAGDDEDTHIWDFKKAGEGSKA